jgi:hypothetical protein
MLSSDSQKITVIASAVYPTEEIYVLNQGLKEVASSVGTLKERLLPGIYKARYVAGSQSAEKMFEVSEGCLEVTVPHPDLSISSPIFFRDPKEASADPGSSLASRISTRMTSQGRIEDCGELLVVIRAAQRNGGKTLAAVQERGVSLKLYDTLGAEVSDLGAALVHSVDRATAACNIELEQSSYLLRFERGNGFSVEQTVVVVARWQTQVFIAIQESDDPSIELGVDIVDVGILMIRRGEGFRSERPEVVRAELSRQALADGRPSVPSKELRAALDLAKRQAESGTLAEETESRAMDPMFGLYAAHLITLSKEPDKNLLREVADHLIATIGNHPDVMALRVWLDPHGEVATFSQVPMLRNSWDILMEHRARFVPPGTYAARVADRLWGTGAWLNWRTPEKLRYVAPPAATIELARFPALVMQNDETAAKFVKAAEELPKEALSESERKLLEYIQTIAVAGSSAVDLAREGIGDGLRGFFRSLSVKIRGRWIRSRARSHAMNVLGASSIAKALAIPEVALAQAVGDLVTRLNSTGTFNIERRGARSSDDVLVEEFVALHPDAQLQDKTLPGLYRSIHALEDGRAALCLAGGGLRGAFFALGVLQGLARCGLLMNFHYLSTVSGGTYIGAWLAAWRYHAQDDNTVLNLLQSGTHNSISPDTPITQLTRGSQYGRGRRGVLSLEMWTHYGRHARNLLLIWLVYIPLILSVLMIPKIYLGLIYASTMFNPTFSFIALLIAVIVLFVALAGRAINRANKMRDGASYASMNGYEPLVLFSVSGALLCTTASLLIFSGLVSALGAAAAVGAVLFAASEIVDLIKPKADESEPGLFQRFSASIFAGAIGGLAFVALFREVGAVFGDSSARAQAIGSVALIVLALILADVVYVGLVSRLKGADRDRSWRAASAGYLSSALVVYLVFAWLDLFGPSAVNENNITIGGISGAVGGVSGALALALAFGSFELSSWRKRIGAASIYMAEGAAIALLAVIVVILSANADNLVENIELAIVSPGPSTAWSWLVAAVTATMLSFILAIAAAFLIDLRAFSSYDLHRGHLVRRFLGEVAASHIAANVPSARQDHDVPMASLWQPEQRRVARRLFPVLNMALDHLGDLRRQKSDSFTVTPLSTGSAPLGYRSSTDYCASEGGISLGTAMVISGAVVDRELVRHTTPLVALMLTLLGARHGLWLGNPKSDVASQRARPRLAFTPTLEELFGGGQTDHVHVSNGDWFDPLGLYEMIRRRCKFIVVSDTGSEPLECLGSVIRKVRLDFGVIIDMFDLELQTAQPISMSACCAIGRIYYPEAARSPPGLIIYLRPNLDGSEPLDIKSYAARHFQSFPGERVSSRHFDEEGAESYRALGAHVVETVSKRRRGDVSAQPDNEYSFKDLAQGVQEYLAARRELRASAERSADRRPGP